MRLLKFPIAKILLFAILFVFSFSPSYAITVLKPESIDLLGNMHFYLGVGSGKTFYKLTDNFKDNLSSQNYSVVSRSTGVNFPVLGIKFIGYYSFSAEIGNVFYESMHIHSNNSTIGKIKLKNTFLDLIGYVPLASDQNNNVKFQILLGMGIAYLKIKEFGDLQLIGNKSKAQKYGFHSKYGIQFNVDQHWSLRGLFGYQKVGCRRDIGAIKSTNFMNIDLTYTV